MLHTPFGVYLLLHELTARSRELAGGGRLLVGFSDRGGKGAGGGVRWIGEADSRIRRWATLHGLTADKPDAGGNPVPLRLALGLIRLTYLELHQKPVVHTEQTLDSDYLGRNRGNLAEYQKVVAVALKDEVAKARARGAMTLLTEDDLRRAQESPEAVAGEHGVDTVTLKRMISGELDTVMNACAGNRRSPHAPAGQPCPASFMLCLECPCARALPRHGGRPRRPGGRSAVSGLFISTQDHDPLDGLADHGQRQRSLPSLALTERDYSVGLNAAKLFRSPIIYPSRSPGV